MAQRQTMIAGADEVVQVGQLKSFRFASEETGWAVANLDVDGVDVTAVGPLAHYHPGEVLALHGRWDEHPQFGPQWKVERVEVRRPQSAVGLERYLETVPGIGPEMAARIVERFGGHTLDVVWDEPDRLAAEIDGIGPTRAKAIQENVLSRREEAEAGVLLRGLDVPEFLVARLLRKYGASAADIIRANPFRLYREVDGIGFKLADRIARAVGVPLESEQRILAGIDYSLREASRRLGHCYLTEPELMSAACEALELRADTVRERLPVAEDEGLVAIDGLRIYPARLLSCECAVADAVASLCRRTEVDPVAADEIARKAGESVDVELSPEQHEAVAASLLHRCMILTGGPGTGKTTVTRAILAAHRGRRIELCAPTGRAAKRLKELTGHRARTIHRMLEYHPDPPDGGSRWRRNSGNPLDADLVLVDETSMVDLPLMYRLTDALTEGCRLVLVGDADQLPSVGPGRVLGDLIDSGAPRVVRLTTVFRQAWESAIIRAAHGVQEGAPPPVPPEGAETDLYWMQSTDPARLVPLIVHLVADRIPDRYGHDAMAGEVMVLSPMKKGPLGTHALNDALRARLNPRRGRKPGIGGFLPGDRVMQTRNDYDLGVFNGDTGIVVATPKGELVVEVDGERVEYTRSAARSLQLAFAATVHKSQGSEYPAVVLVAHRSHWIMLRRPLLYTGMTRAARLLVMAGDPEAAGIAARTTTDERRNTALDGRVRDLAPGG